MVSKKIYVNIMDRLVVSKKYVKLLGACMRLLLGAKSMPFGCMSMDRLGAKYAVVGCKYAETFGCKVCGCWVQVS